MLGFARTRVPVIVVAMSLCLAAFAQARPRHSLGGAVGIGVHSARDDTLVPLAHTGPRLALSPRYFGDLGFGLLFADGRFAMAYVLGAEGEEGLTSIWGLHAGLLFQLDAGANHALSLGPAFGWDNETFYFGDWDDAHAYWLGTLWLGPRMHNYRRLNERWRADFDVQIALLGFFSRPPAYRYHKQETSDDVLAYFEWPTHDLRPGWFGDFQVLRASIEFFRSKRRGPVPTGLGLGVETSFSHASSPDDVLSFEALARCSYTWEL